MRSSIMRKQGTLIQASIRMMGSVKSSSHSISFHDSLLSTAETKVSFLKNGLRIATEDSGGENATVGLYFQNGSRFESPSENGASHFFEHLFMKGTAKRTQPSLEAEIEGLGGHLDSFTSRECSSLFIHLPKKEVSKAVEILGDLVQNVNLSAENVESTRKAILDEQENVENDSQRSVMEHLFSTAFQGGNLAQTILGTQESIKSLKVDQLKNFLKTNYTAPRIVLAAAGGVSHSDIVQVAEQALGGLSSTEKAPVLKTPRFVGSEIKIRDDEKDEVHIAFAVQGPSITSPDYFPMLIVQYIMGSWDRTLGGGKNLSSRLAQSIATHNLCTGYNAFTSSFSDTGLFGFYTVGDVRDRLDDLMFQFQNDWVRICVNVSEHEVERAKNQLKAALLSQNNGSTATFHTIGQQMINYGRKLTDYEIHTRVDAIDKATVKKVAYHYLYDKDPAIVAFGPVEGFPDYNRIQTATSWLRV